MIEKAHSKLIEYGTSLNREQHKNLIADLLHIFKTNEKEMEKFKVACIKRGGFTYITPGLEYTVAGEANLRYAIVDDQKRLNYYPKELFKK